jgi:hypothetical protein
MDAGNDVSTSEPKPHVARKTLTGRTDADLLFFQRSYACLNACVLVALGCVVLFLAGLSLPASTANAVVPVCAIVPTVIFAVCSFIIANRLHGLLVGMLCGFISATIVGWLVLLVLRKNLAGILKRNGYRVALFTAIKK